MQKDEKKQSTNREHCKKTLRNDIMRKLQEREFERKCRREEGSEGEKKEVKNFEQKGHPREKNQASEISFKKKKTTTFNDMKISWVLSKYHGKNYLRAFWHFIFQNA